MIVYLHNIWQLLIAGEPQGVGFAIMLYAVLVLGYSLIKQYDAMHWPSISGQLINKGMRNAGFEGEAANTTYTSKALYTYEVEQQEYQGTRISPWVIVTNKNASFLLENQLNKIEHLGQNQVKVFYNPRKPAKSFLIKPSKIGFFITLLCAVLPIIYYINRFH